jgi:hypothetical protein
MRASALLLTLLAIVPVAAAHAGPYDEDWSYDRHHDNGLYDERDEYRVYEGGWRDGYESGYYDSVAEHDHASRDRRNYEDDGYRCPHGSRSGGTALGAIGGGVLGHVIAPRKKKLLGTVIGGVAGGVVGNQIAGARDRC